MVRDAEKQFKSAIKQQPMIGTFLMLGKVNSQSSLSLSSLHWSVRFLHFLVLHWVNWFSSLSRSCFTFDQLVFFSKVYLRLDQPLAALEVRWEKEQNQISFMDSGHPFLSFPSSCVPCKLHPVLGVQNWSWLLSKRSYPPGESSWSETSQVLLQILLQGGSCKSARGSWQSRPLCQVSKI